MKLNEHREPETLVSGLIRLHENQIFIEHKHNITTCTVYAQKCTSYFELSYVLVRCVTRALGFP